MTNREAPTRGRTPEQAGPPPRCIVAVPVRNEVDRIEACRRALAGQEGIGAGALGIVLFLNNCTDGTAEAVADLAGSLGLPLRVIEREYPGAQAGWARREAMEETGLRLTALEFIASAWSMSGISTERMDLFLAVYGTADRIGAGGGLAAEGEAVTIHEIPLRDLAAMGRDGRLTDMKSLTLLFALQLQRPDLFTGLG